MGMICSAWCTCGYESTQVEFGAGMADFNAHCSAPALCRNCQKVVSTEFFASDHKCRSCRGSVGLYAEVRGDSDYEYESGQTWRIDDTRVLYLSYEGNRCPRCRDHSLTFSVTGAFD
jgi:hypothetical protein